MMFANIKAYSGPRAAIRGVVGTRLPAQLGVRVVRRVLQLVQKLEQRPEVLRVKLVQVDGPLSVLAYGRARARAGVCRACLPLEAGLCQEPLKSSLVTPPIAGNSGGTPLTPAVGAGGLLERDNHVCKHALHDSYMFANMK